MGVWIICHPSFLQTQPSLEATLKGKLVKTVIKHMLGVEPLVFTRGRELSYLAEDIAPHPENYPSLIFWSGRIGKRGTFDDGYGGTEKHYWGNGRVMALEKRVTAQLPQATPRFYRFSETAAEGVLVKLAVRACREVAATQSQLVTA